jgi:hypothetical protein
MKRYFPDDRQNKAAMILASMSPDMVSAISDLISQAGVNVTNTLFAVDDGPPRPLAIFSEAFVTDNDFPCVWYGFLTTVMADLRTAGADAEQYAKMLVDAFGISEKLAQPLAKKIESYDTIGASYKSDSDSRAWYEKLSGRLQEGIRRIANMPNHLLGLGGFLYNDQTQKYDIDYLYEMYVLGQVVDDLMVRGRLMKGQSAINQSLGLLAVGDPGDEDARVASIYATLRPLAGAPIPAVIAGGAKKLMESVTKDNLTAALNLLAKAGIIKDKTNLNAVEDNELRGHVLDLVEGKTPGLDAFASPPTGTELLTFHRKVKRRSRRPSDTDIAYQRVEDDYGPAVADAWATGDPVELYHALRQSANEPDIQTGDPEMDAAILADAHDAVTSGLTPAMMQADKETGFLFFGSKKKKRAKKAAEAREAQRNKFTQDLEDKLWQQQEAARLQQQYSVVPGVNDPATAYSQQVMGMMPSPPPPTYTGAYPYSGFAPAPNYPVNYASTPNTLQQPLPSYATMNNDPNMLGMFPDSSAAYFGAQQNPFGYFPLL